MGTASGELMGASTVTLAQGVQVPEFDFAGFAVWFAVVVVLVALTLVVMRYARKNAIEDGLAGEPVFELRQLCELRDGGKLSEAEYETLSAAAVARAASWELLVQLRDLRDAGTIRIPDHDRLRALVVKRLKTEPAPESSGRAPTAEST